MLCLCGGGCGGSGGLIIFMGELVVGRRLIFLVDVYSLSRRTYLFVESERSAERERAQGQRRNGRSVE